VALQAWAEARRVGPQAVAQAVALAQALGPEEWPGEWPGEWPVQAHTFTYADVLADSKLKDIIYSIEPDHRHTLASHLYSSHTSQKYWWLIQIITPITRLPPELLQQILLFIVDEASDSPLALMQVCKHWHAIVTGIWGSLKLGTTTPKDAVTTKLERNQRFLDVVVDTEIDRGHFTPSEGAYQAIFAAIEATDRWRSFVVETFPPQADLPEHLVNSGLQRCSDVVMNRIRTFRIKCACEASPLLDHLLRILGKSASRELTTVEINSPNVISFLAPTYSTIFHSVKVLSLCLDTPGLRNPVDLLPHLHQLESLTASRLSFPIYNNDVDLPFVHTLRHLSLRAVSIQWMSGRTFHALESFALLFPLHHHIHHTFSTTLPNCKHLTFQGYPLDVLNGISARNLDHLSVTCSSSFNLRGTWEFVQFSSQALRQSRLSPRILHLSIEAMSEAWIKALAFMSGLEELVIENARPSSLGAKVLQSLVVHPIHTPNSGTTATPEGRNAPLCPSLKRLGLRYGRWLRPNEPFDLIPEFMSIILSRQRSKFPLLSFQIWIRSDEKDPLELIDGSWISLEGFERLMNASAINLLQVTASKYVENMDKPSGRSSTTYPQRLLPLPPPPGTPPPPPPPSPPPLPNPPSSSNAQALSACDPRAKEVAGPKQCKRDRAEAGLDDGDPQNTTGGRRVRRRHEQWNDVPSAGPAGPCASVAYESPSRPLTTGAWPGVTQGTTPHGVSSSNGSSTSPATSATPIAATPTAPQLDLPLRPIQGHQSSPRPVESTYTVLRSANPRKGPVSGGTEVWLAVDDLPTTFTLYARFGSQVAATVSPIFHPLLLI